MVPIVEAESPEHKRLVEALIEYLKEERFTITCAARSGYTQCDEVRGYAPDIRGTNAADELNVIGEAKTCDDLGSFVTIAQLRAFSNRVMTDGKSKGKDVPFYIAIPKNCEKELEATLHNLGLDTKTNIHRVPF